MFRFFFYIHLQEKHNKREFYNIIKFHKMADLNKINELEKVLKSFQPLKPEYQKILDKKFRLEFNYNTNHIEGNTITYSETELLLIFDDAKGDHSLRELEEMKGSDVAFQLMQELALDNKRPLTEQNIKYLNEILLVRPFWKDAITPDGQSTRRLIKVGDYKEYPNSVRLQNGEIFNYASPMDTPIKMAELIEWYRIEEKKKELSPIVLAAMLHYKFVLIHPFDDGNGRISRLLMNYVLFKNNLPPIIIKTSDKRNYLAALNRADTGDIESFTKYIAEQLIWSLELSIKAANGESLDEPGDLDKKIKLLKQKLNSSDEVVKITKSKEAILELLNKNIEPMLRQLSTKLSEFDSLFKEKAEGLSAGGTTLGSNLDRSFNVVRAHLREKPYAQLLYNFRLLEFRKGPTPYNFQCSLEIQFHHNVYEVKSADAKFIFSKLYHQDISEIEIAQIVEELGMYVYNQIEKSLDG